MNLPTEDGFNQRSGTRARFAPDGLPAYIMTFAAKGDNDTSASFLYALGTDSAASSPVLQSTRITLQALDSGSSVDATSKVTVKDGTGTRVAGATVAVTWNLPSGTTATQAATTNQRSSSL